MATYGPPSKKSSLDEEQKEEGRPRGTIPGQSEVEEETERLKSGEMRKGEANRALAVEEVEAGMAARALELRTREQSLEAEKAMLVRRLAELEVARIEVQLQLELLGEDGVDQDEF